jgi:hypothetical protein
LGWWDYAYEHYAPNFRQVKVVGVTIAGALLHRKFLSNGTNRSLWRSCSVGILTGTLVNFSLPGYKENLMKRIPKDFLGKFKFFYLFLFVYFFRLVLNS